MKLKTFKPYISTKIKIIILFLVFVWSDCFAQMANPSKFSEIKSINPAVISNRLLGQFTALASYETLDRTQDHGAILGGDSKVESITTINQLSIFRGGKCCGVTSEILLKYVTGDVTDKIITDIDSSETKSEASSSIAGISFGLGKYLGIGFSYSTFERDYSTSFTDTGGETFSTVINNDFTFISIKPGLRIGKTFSFGAYFEQLIQTGERTTTSTTPSGGTTTTSQDDFPKIQIYGGAIGVQTKSFNFEVSYESAIESNEKSGSNQLNAETKTPSRISSIIESKIGKILIGYKGSYVSGLFTEIENILVSQLLYPNALTSTRLENTINFSTGSSKGSSFGLSAFYSQSSTNETSVVIVSDEKLKTETTAYGFSVKFGYVF